MVIGQIGTWVTCSRCGTPQMLMHPSACAGASEPEPGFYTCNNGRDCSLRLARKLRSRR